MCQIHLLFIASDKVLKVDWEQSGPSDVVDAIRSWRTADVGHGCGTLRE